MIVMDVCEKMWNCMLYFSTEINTERELDMSNEVGQRHRPDVTWQLERRKLELTCDCRLASSRYQWPVLTLVPFTSTLMGLAPSPARLKEKLAAPPTTSRTT